MSLRDMIAEARGLDARLLAAHAAGDGDALVALYGAAGEREEAGGALDAACFYYTHAYVYALEAGHAAAAALHARLVAHGRER